MSSDPGRKRRKSGCLVSLAERTEEGCEVFITVGKDSCRYSIVRIPVDYGIGFTVSRKDEQRPDKYQVGVERRGELVIITCDCPGGIYLAGQSKCKHVLAVEQMSREGIL